MNVQGSPGVRRDMFRGSHMPLISRREGVHCIDLAGDVCITMTEIFKIK